MRKMVTFSIALTLVLISFLALPMNASAEDYSCPACAGPVEYGTEICPYCGEPLEWGNGGGGGYQPEGNTLITDYLNHRIIEVDPDNNIVWEVTDLDYPIDAERLENGNTLFVEFGEYQANGRVTEVDGNGNEVWKYDTALNWPWDVERLEDGNTLITDQKNNRIIEVEGDGTIAWQVSAGLKNTARPNLYWPVDAERLGNGNTLIVDLGNNRVIEVEPDFDVVWETPYIGSLQDGERLDTGNTLITRVNDIVFELDSSYNMVWSYTGLGYPGDAERLTNGNTLIADGWGSHRVLEVDSIGNIVWEPTGLGLNWPYDVERLEGAPPTPEESTEELLDDIIGFEFPQGTENELTKTLDNVLKSIENENDNAATGQLGSFINKIEALLRSERISEEEAQALIEAAEAIIAGIEEE
jgi:hypothetical protein